MADDNLNIKKNQIPPYNPKPEPLPGKVEPKTIFETVPIEEHPRAASSPKELKPEEAPPDLSSPDQPVPPDGPPMFIEEPDNRRKYLIIGAAVLGFFLLFRFHSIYDIWTIN